MPHHDLTRLEQFRLRFLLGDGTQKFRQSTLNSEQAKAGEVEEVHRTVAV
jgi:hypothetical protein